MKEKMPGTLTLRSKIMLVVLPFMVALIALGIGRMGITPIEVVKVLLNKIGLANFALETANAEQVIVAMRLPRILLAALVGSGLAVAGCAFQSLFANPLATPDTLGVASGASFGAALGLLIGLNLIGVQLMALFMGIVAVGLTWFGGSGKGKGMSTVVLAGIMIGSLFTALVSFVKFVADTDSQLPAITYWLMGSLSSAGYRSLALGAPLILLGMGILVLIRWRLNLLPLSDDEAKASGTNIRLLRGITVFCATLITASCIAMCGQVGWVGLLVPHMCRMKWGNNHLSLLPASISIGVIFMIVVDTIARTLTAAEIPISILTAIIGAPFFLYLMRKSGGWQL